MGKDDKDKPDKPDKPKRKSPKAKKPRVKKNPLLKKRKVVSEFKNPLDLDNDATRGTVTQNLTKEEWIQELKKEGFTDFYSRATPDGKQPLGTKAFDGDDFGKGLNKVFPTGGPDLVAVDHKKKQILAGDVTAKSSTGANIKDFPGIDKDVHHLEKTKLYGEKIASHIGKEPGLEKYSKYDVYFQDRYGEQTGKKTSARFKVLKHKAAVIPPVPDRAIDGGKPDKKKKATSKLTKKEQDAELKKKRLEDIRKVAERKKAVGTDVKDPKDTPVADKKDPAVKNKKPSKAKPKLSPKVKAKVKAKANVKPKVKTKVDPKDKVKPDAASGSDVKVQPKPDVKATDKVKPDVKQITQVDPIPKGKPADVKTSNLSDARGLTYKPSQVDRGLKVTPPVKATTPQKPVIVQQDVTPPVKPKVKGKLNIKLKLSPKLKVGGGFVISIAFDLFLGWLEARGLAENIEEEISKHTSQFQSLLEAATIEEDIAKFRVGENLENGYQLYFKIRLFITRSCSDGGCGTSGRINSMTFMDVAYSRVKGKEFMPDATDDEGWNDTYNGKYGSIATFYNPIFESGHPVHQATEDAADERATYFNDTFTKREGKSMGDHGKEYYLEFVRYCEFFPESKAAEQYYIFAYFENLTDITRVELAMESPFVLMNTPHNLEFHEVINKVRWGLANKVGFILDFYNYVLQMNAENKIYYLEKYDKYFQILDEAYTKCQSSCHTMIGDRRIIHRITADDVRRESQFMFGGYLKGMK